ncbi:MAG: penicillin acylase family protein [Deltaproteobacteria bacterium]|nr:MAG: penicillin acylase family protein [Deltaproteobacteria bacterium]
MAKSRSHGWIWVVLLLVLGVVGWLGRRPLRALYQIAKYRLSPDYPRNTDQTHALPGLNGKARVQWDKYGIPHIFAANDKDISRAAGFVHARYRFFQMDMLRRVAQGRISEVVGRQPFLSSTTVAFDRAMRGWGFKRRALNDMKTLSQYDRAIVEAYSQGVNAALKKFPPWEYRLLNLKPEPWKPSDSFVLAMLNTWSISHNWQQELVRLLLAMNVGAKRSMQIYPHEPLKGGDSLPGRLPPRKLQPAIAKELLAMFPAKPYKKLSQKPLPQNYRLAADIALLGAASNAWVVNANRSKSGKPLLANDPHLSHFLPSLLFQQHLTTPTLNVIGVTFPGIPFVLIGHNQHVAWAMTSAVADAIDLVIEKPDPKNKDRVLHDTKVCKLLHEKVVIQVREKGVLKSETYTMRRSCHGPLLNDMYPHLLNKEAPLVAIRWDVSGFTKQVGTFQKVNRAKSVKELYELMTKLTSPVSTAQAVDVAGNIALFWAGTVPKRPHHRGTFPVPGWLKKYDFAGLVPPKEVPMGLNPSQGFLAHGNNMLANPTLQKHTYHVDSAPPYRWQRITELIQKTPKHDVDSFGAIQQDVKILRAKAVLPYILKDLATLKAPTKKEKQAIALLKKWDYMAHKDSPAASLFFSVYRNSVMSAIQDELSASAGQFFMSQRYSTNISDGWFTKPGHVVWDNRATKATETRADIVIPAFRKAITTLTQRLGSDVSQWKWGRLHTFHFRHLFGGQKILAGMVNLPKRPAGGSMESVWKSHHNLGHPKTPFRTVAGPSLRMLVDMGDLSKGKWIIDTGASGWPLSPHYGDQFERWYKGQYVPMVFTPEQVKDNTVGTWTLTP